MTARRIVVRPTRSRAVPGRVVALRRVAPRVPPVTWLLCTSCREQVAVCAGECAECALMREAPAPPVPWSLAWADELETEVCA